MTTNALKRGTCLTSLSLMAPSLSIAPSCSEYGRRRSQNPRVTYGNCMSGPTALHPRISLIRCPIFATLPPFKFMSAQASTPMVANCNFPGPSQSQDTEFSPRYISVSKPCQDAFPACQGCNFLTS